MPGEIAMLDRKESEDGLPVFVFFMIVILMQSVLGCLFIHFGHLYFFSKLCVHFIYFDCLRI